MNPLVSIIVISYNHEDYLEQAIKSVYQQTYKNVELIVTDDCSKDNSDKVIKAIQETYKFRYIPNATNIGLNNTLINALNVAQGEFISIFSADDYIVENKIERQLGVLLEKQGDGICSNGYQFNCNTTKPLTIDPVFLSSDRSKILNYLYQYDWNAPLVQSGLFKRDIFLSLLWIRKEYKSDDWAFMINAYQQFNILYLDEYLFYYRIHDNNTHKNYWYTLPMRVEIACKLVPENYRLKTLSNLFFLQGQSAAVDKKLSEGFRLYMASFILNFSISKMYSMVITYLGLLKRRLTK